MDGSGRVVWPAVMVPGMPTSFALHSAHPAGSVAATLGHPEYSYRFVLDAFRPALAALGDTIVVAHPSDAEAVHAAGQGGCVLLSFAPPHLTPLGLACPVVPVIAWEFSTIPDEPWEDEPRHDWCHVLAQTGRAIALSSYTADVVRRAMGAGYQVAAIPAPVWDRFAALGQAWPAQPMVAERMLRMPHIVVDSAAYTFRPGAPIPDIAPPCLDGTPVGIGGVVYAAVLSPADGRKNWRDLLTGFCWAFRDTPDATLALKMVQTDLATWIWSALLLLGQLSPFRCRVVIFDGYLDDAAYEAFVASASYYVNTSHGEGLCLPLMEFMAAGRPAIAPDHTAMADYVDSSCAFVLRSDIEPTIWPHHPGQGFRTLRHRLEIDSLIAAYRDSYRVAKGNPRRYAAMGRAASERVRQHAALAVVQAKLRRALAC